MNEINENAVEQAGEPLDPNLERLESLKRDLLSLQARMDLYAKSNPQAADRLQREVDEKVHQAEKSLQQTMKGMENVLTMFEAADRPKDIRALEEEVGGKSVLLAYYTLFDIGEADQESHVNALLDGEQASYQGFMEILKGIQAGKGFDLHTVSGLDSNAKGTIWKHKMQIGYPGAGEMVLDRGGPGREWFVEFDPTHPDWSNELEELLRGPQNYSGVGVPKTVVEFLRNKATENKSVADADQDLEPNS